MENTQSLDFSEYIAVFKRRRVLIAAIVLPIVAVGLGLAVGLPDIYRSAATIEFTEAEVSGELRDRQRGQMVYEEEHVANLTATALSKEYLAEILQEVQVLPDQAEDPEKALGTIRENTAVTTVRTEVLDPNTGRDREIISSFTVAYDSQDPSIAHEVATRLADAFVKASRANLRQRAAAISEFYASEAEQSRGQIGGLEAKLADFKKANYGRLPELAGVNMTGLDRTERDLENIQLEMRTLNQNRIYLLQQIQQARAAGPDGGNTLQQLEAEYSRKSSIYDETHPDLAALRRQIDGMRAGGPAAANMTLAEQLTSQRTILETARQRYSDDHPDVKRILRNIEMLEARIARGEKVDASQYSSPVTSQLQTQLAAIDTQLAALRGRSAELRGKMTEFESRVEATPLVEREYQGLTRDLDLARKKYDELLSNHIDADLRVAAIAGGRSDELKIVRRPGLPSAPAEPNRLGILMISLVLGLVIAFSAAIATESLDQTVRGSRDIQRALSVTPLASIPMILDIDAKRVFRKRAAMYAGSLLAGMVLLIIVVRASAA